MLVIVGTGCDSGARRDALGDGAASTSSGRGGASGGNESAEAAAPPVAPGDAVCNGTTCHPGTSGVQSTACCTDTSECGLRIVLSPECLSRNEKGGVDARCAPFEIPGQLTLPGCCSPTGCGALATSDNLGCIPNAALSRTTVPCTPDVPFQ
jgi:hypothetical protein